MITFRVKNFEKFQHYKDRAPPWIKLYNGLLEDYEFGCLPDASKMHLIAIWLLASRTGNKMPFDPRWVAGRINATDPVDLDVLVEGGFILLDQELPQAERVASKPQAVRLTREEGQVQHIEQRKNTRSASPSDENFQNFKRDYPKRAGNYGWKAAEKKYLALVKTGVDPGAIHSAVLRHAEEMRKLKRIGTEFVPMPASWLNQEDFSESAVAALEEKPIEIDWPGVLNFYKKTGRWSPQAGPDPDSMACKAPPDLLREFGLLKSA